MRKTCTVIKLKRHNVYLLEDIVVRCTLPQRSCLGWFSSPASHKFRACQLLLLCSCSQTNWMSCRSGWPPQSARSPTTLQPRARLLPFKAPHTSISSHCLATSQGNIKKQTISYVYIIVFYLANFVNMFITKKGANNSTCFKISISKKSITMSTMLILYFFLTGIEITWIS